MTAQKEGVVIRHLTSTVVNSNTIQKMAHGENVRGLSVESITVSKSNLLQNNWSNVLLYTPKEQVFKVNLNQLSNDKVSRKE